MGYPMTFRRFVARNGLTDGDYGNAPQQHRARVLLSTTEATTESEHETLLARAPGWCDRVGEYEHAFKMLVGDLRRLERDAVDESAVCKLIAARTGVDAEVVAGVLKEFLAT